MVARDCGGCRGCNDGSSVVVDEMGVMEARVVLVVMVFMKGFCVLAQWINFRNVSKELEV